MGSRGTLPDFFSRDAVPLSLRVRSSLLQQLRLHDEFFGAPRTYPIDQYLDLPLFSKNNFPKSVDRIYKVDRAIR